MSPSGPKFLLDENVRIELLKFLKKNSFDAVQVRGITNGKVAEISRLQKRVLVTNDSDFTNRSLYPKENVFSVVILKLPQSDAVLLIKSFSLVLKFKPEDLKGRIFELKNGCIFALE
ncbi:DUF5615 family PIN-like protein [archaeon]|nr:DUF5615 family PIN-like protein [archaeon]